MGQVHPAECVARVARGGPALLEGGGAWVCILACCVVWPPDLSLKVVAEEGSVGEDLQKGQPAGLDIAPRAEVQRGQVDQGERRPGW